WPWASRKRERNRTGPWRSSWSRITPRCGWASRRSSVAPATGSRRRRTRPRTLTSWCSTGVPGSPCSTSTSPAATESSSRGPSSSSDPSNRSSCTRASRRISGSERRSPLAFAAWRSRRAHPKSSCRPSPRSPRMASTSTRGYARCSGNPGRCAPAASSRSERRRSSGSWRRGSRARRSPTGSCSRRRRCAPTFATGCAASEPTRARTRWRWRSAPARSRP
ncbi:MAG: hypothetical protein AVDCRST_MAG45-65, partial [uncultured Solirubrobacterales bacterium]